MQRILPTIVVVLAVLTMHQKAWAAGRGGRGHVLGGPAGFAGSTAGAFPGGPMQSSPSMNSSSRWMPEGGTQSFSERNYGADLLERNRTAGHDTIDESYRLDRRVDRVDPRNPISGRNRDPRILSSAHREAVKAQSHYDQRLGYLDRTGHTPSATLGQNVATMPGHAPQLPATAQSASHVPTSGGHPLSAYNAASAGVPPQARFAQRPQPRPGEVPNAQGHGMAAQPRQQPRVVAQQLPGRSIYETGNRRDAAARNSASSDDRVSFGQRLRRLWPFGK